MPRRTALARRGSGSDSYDVEPAAVQVGGSSPPPRSQAACRAAPSSLIGVGVVYLTAGTPPASGTAGASAPRSPSAPASPVSSSTPPAALTLNDLLTSQSAAPLAGNEAGWLASVKPSDKSTVAVYRRFYDGSARCA